MILSFVFLFLILLFACATIYYLYAFFIPALKIKYTDYNDSLASNFQFEDDSSSEYAKDISRIAVIENHTENKTIENRRLQYSGERSCRLFHSIYGSKYIDEKICIGYGDCTEMCPQSAISVKDKPVVLANLCNGCGKCISSCPVGLISLKDRNSVKNEALNDQKLFKFWNRCYKLLKG